jgi:hypothetical protein
LSRYFLTGGRQRPTHLRARDEWTAYERAVLLSLDTRTGAARVVLEYASPPDRCPATDPSFVFKAASWDGPHLLLCTQTEVIVFDPVAERIVRTISHPWFNDVHHVARIGGRLHVVSTGLDAVLVLGDDDEVVEVLSAVGDDPWSRFDRATDWRRVPTTKPHAAHPNFVTEVDGHRWLTRFVQRDALDLDGGSAVRLADDPVHDGVLVDGRLWYTVVSGHVVVVEPGRGVVARYDLDRVGDEGGRPLGWARGIHVDAGVTLIAFSRLRPTTLKQNLSWLRTPLGRPPEPHPTRVVAYDFAAGRKLHTWTVEQVGISSIFSVLPAEPRGSHA